jgi:hypothetical protein
MVASDDVHNFERGGTAQHKRELCWRYCAAVLTRRPGDDRRYSVISIRSYWSVRVAAQEGHTPNQTRSLVKEITDVLIRNFNVAPELVMVQIIAKDRSGKPRCSVHRAAAMSFIDAKPS